MPLALYGMLYMQPLTTLTDHPAALLSGKPKHQQTHSQQRRPQGCRGGSCTAHMAPSFEYKFLGYLFLVTCSCACRQVISHVLVSMCS